MSILPVGLKLDSKLSCCFCVFLHEKPAGLLQTSQNMSHLKTYDWLGILESYVELQPWQYDCNWRPITLQTCSSTAKLKDILSLYSKYTCMDLVNNRSASLSWSLGYSLITDEFKNYAEYAKILKTFPLSLRKSYFLNHINDTSQ